MMCCTALCANGLVHEGLFTDSSEAEAGAALYRELSSCHFSRLPDTSATPQVIAQVLSSPASHSHLQCPTRRDALLHVQAGSVNRLQRS